MIQNLILVDVEIYKLRFKGFFGKIQDTVVSGAKVHNDRVEALVHFPRFLPPWVANGTRQFTGSARVAAHVGCWDLKQLQ